MSRQRWGSWGRRLVLVTLCATISAGCSFTSVQSMPLPLNEGDEAFPVTVEMEQVANLLPNSEVKVDDVTVGTVVDEQVENWKAKVVVHLNEGTVLPANATARVGQKSLLGAEYLQLSGPVAEPPVGRLAPGDTIPLARTTRYPETEEVLAALSVVLNGSGLQQIRTIIAELNKTLGGREQDVRSLIGNLNTFVGGLDAQRADIVRAIDQLNRFSGTLARDRQVLEAGIDQIPPALGVLNQDRDALVNSLQAISRFGDTAVAVVDQTRGDLLANLAQLRPALQSLANTGKDLTQSLPTLVTYPFPSDTAFPAMFRGDYANLFATIDLTPETLAKYFLGGFQLPIAGGPSVLRLPPLGAGQNLQSPLSALQLGGTTDRSGAPLTPGSLAGGLTGGGR